MKITAIYGSPRKDGNTDLLMKSFLRGTNESNIQAHEIFVRDLKFSPCIECCGCDKTGKCVLNDDMQAVYPHLTESDILVFAAPVFFYAINAQAKALIDRCQCFWVEKYVLNKKPSNKRGAKGKGVFLSAGGSKGKKNFDGIFLTMRYFFDVINMDFSDQLTYGNIDNKGAVLKHSTAIDDAYNLGMTIAKSFRG